MIKETMKMLRSTLGILEQTEDACRDKTLNEAQSNVEYNIKCIPDSEHLQACGIVQGVEFLYQEPCKQPDDDKLSSG